MSTKRRLTPWMIGVGVVNRFGRRPLLLTGLVGMTVSLAAVGGSFAALVPETKGRSLEEIQERWVIGGDRMLEEEAA